MIVAEKHINLDEVIVYLEGSGNPGDQHEIAAVEFAYQGGDRVTLTMRNDLEFPIKAEKTEVYP